MPHLNPINSALLTLLQTVQLQGSAAFVDCLDYPTNEFSGYPSCFIRPTPAPAQYATVVQNQRAYGFSVNIFVGLDQEPDWQATNATMRDLVDAVLDAIDRTIDLGATADFIDATGITAWEPVEAGSGLALWAELMVVARKDIPLY